MVFLYCLFPFSNPYGEFLLAKRALKASKGARREAKRKRPLKLSLCCQAFVSPIAEPGVFIESREGALHQPTKRLLFHLIQRKEP
jgi:hypothetical protein